MTAYDQFSLAHKNRHSPERSGGSWRGPSATRERFNAAKRRLRQSALVPITLTIAMGWGTLAVIPKPIPKPQPALLAGYQHRQLATHECPEFSAEQAQKILDVDRALILSDVLHEPSKHGEIVNSDCVFSDPADLEQQVTYSRFRLMDDMNRYGQNAIVDTDWLMRLEQTRGFGTPYSAEYPGFGTRTTMDQDGHQSAWWLCGNQAITIALRTKQPNPTDRSSTLWTQLEPTISDRCGTADNPATIPATDDGIRIDEVRHAAEKAEFKAPTLWSVRKDGDYDPAIPLVTSGSRTSYYDDVEYVSPCPWLSETAGHLSGQRKVKWQSRGYRYTKVGGLGARTAQCEVIGRKTSLIPGRASKTPRLEFIELEFEPYTDHGSERYAESFENVARVHANPSTRAPYARKYHGFGVVHPARVKGSLRLEWLCRNHRLTVDFSVGYANRRITNDEIWQVSEAAINYFCKPVDQPTKLAGNEQQYRIDYTKKLMQDWGIWTDQPRSTPPAVKNYVWPSIYDSVIDGLRYRRAIEG